MPSPKEGESNPEHFQALSFCVPRTTRVRALNTNSAQSPIKSPQSPFTQQPHNTGIVRASVDPGKSGTSIKGRKGLQELLCLVESGAADFDQVLVYDVSRWGWFLDTDEAAHYEYLCKRAGIVVRYCAEQFENDNSTTSNLLKALNRTMAGEFSRELSIKVSAGSVASLLSRSFVAILSGRWHEKTLSRPRKESTTKNHRVVQAPCVKGGVLVIRVSVTQAAPRTCQSPISHAGLPSLRAPSAKGLPR